MLPFYNIEYGVDGKKGYETLPPGHLVVVHAGKKPGITSMLNVTNGLLQLVTSNDLFSNALNFYVVRK